ncbi:MAG: PepSY domain-containing protein, partial [Spirochaetaceae bacterium]|nr:PepSY domain-containing protein [Spirochaetaceae bacterium]
MMLSGKKLIAVSMVFFIFFCPVFAQDQESSIGFDKAEEIALEESGGGTVVKSKMDRDDRMFMYEITVVNNNTRYEFEISVDDGAIYEYTESMIRTDRSRRETAADTSISREEAESIAL